MNSFTQERIKKLSNFCKDYFIECLHVDKGFNIIYLVDRKNFSFCSYFSTNFEIIDLIDPTLSKEESIGKVIYAIDCKQFKNYDKDDIDEMSYNMAFVLFGFISNLSLSKEFSLPDDTDYFISKSLS